MQSSIVSYPERGHYGNNKYRGNCSGKLIEDLLLHYKPKRFLECFAGGGTGYEVAKKLGYKDSIHLDLNPRFGSFNLLTDEIPAGSDFVFSHPPYWDIIKYSGQNNMWGREAHDGDLSHIKDYDEFIKKIDHVNAKIYASLVNGGHHAFLVGDVRRKGKYYSIVKDMAWIGDVDSYLIKQQHNTMSSQKSYKKPFIPIDHEHLIVFKKKQIWHVPMLVTRKAVQNLKDSLKITWRDLIQAVIESLGGHATLKQLYDEVQGAKKALNNNHYQAKIRQTLQLHDDFKCLERGKWALAHY